MSDTTDLILVFLALMLLDLISLITFKKSVKEPRNWKNRIRLKSIIAKRHSLIFPVVEITGVIFVIYSFFIPWYYHIYTGFGWFRQFHEFYLIEADGLHDIFSILLYYSYLIGLVIIFAKIAIKKKMKSRILLEIGEAILVFPGLMLIFSVPFGRIPSFTFLLGLQNTLSCPSSGFILYTIGITVLMLNGLYFSVFSRFFRS